MELGKLILEYIKTLIWPGVTITLALLFRNTLEQLLSRLKKADLPGDVSLNFSEEMDEAKQISEKVESIPIKEENLNKPIIPLTEVNSRLISLKLQPSASGLDMNYYRDLARQDPNLSLAGLRMEFEVLARNLAKGFKIPILENIGGFGLLRELKENGAITLDQMMLAHKVLNLCNAAIHGKQISYNEALQVLDLADVLRSYYIRWLSWGFDDDWKPTEG